MSVYERESPENLSESMNSIYAQTVPTDDFVLVCDGPIGAELDRVIDGMREKFGDRLNVIRLGRHEGLGNALNIGIGCCKNDLIARMDSDDISFTDRCERQLRIFQSDSRVGICSGFVDEFITDPGKTESRREVPETQEEILNYAKKRNPFNHPCVMYRKKAVDDAGGYKDFYLLEDYYLWVRMLIAGVEGYNIQSPLLYMRTGNDMYKRRGGIKYAKSQAALMKYMYENGFITRSEYISNAAVRGCAAIVPNSVRKVLYAGWLRSN